jgi:hypothetical protein
VTAQLPPHDLLTEDVVLAACIMEQATPAMLDTGLRAEHFYDPSNARIFAACADLSRAGEVDLPGVVAYLRDRGQLQGVGGIEAVSKRLDAPSVADLDSNAQRLQSLALARRARGELLAALAQLEGAEDISVRLAAVREAASRLAHGATGGRSLPLRAASDVPADLPPVAHVLERLHLAPGRPACLVGYAGAGKTMLAADMALAVSAPDGVGATCWGGIEVTRRGEVVMIDLEVGDYLTSQRLSRLAVGRWSQLSAWGNRLTFACFPRWSLAMPGAEEVLASTLRGKTLAIIDSLTMLLGGADENSSSVADMMGLLARVSERTGCAILVLHHEGKPPVDGPKAAHLRGRGSSAIQGMWSSQWAVSSRDGRLILEHGKSQWGALQPSWSCQIADVCDDDGRKVGVRLAPVASEEGAVGAPPPGALQNAKRQILDALEAFGPMGGSDLVKKVKAGKDTKFKALADLQKEERVVRVQNGKGVLFSLPSQAFPPPSGKASRDRWDDEGKTW